MSPPAGELPYTHISGSTVSYCFSYISALRVIFPEIFPEISDISGRALSTFPFLSTKNETPRGQSGRHHRQCRATAAAAARGWGGDTTARQGANAQRCPRHGVTRISQGSLRDKIHSSWMPVHLAHQHTQMTGSAGMDRGTSVGLSSGPATIADGMTAPITAPDSVQAGTTSSKGMHVRHKGQLPAPGAPRDSGRRHTRRRLRRMMKRTDSATRPRAGRATHRPIPNKYQPGSKFA